jgi:hypothetical protein
MYPSFNDYYQGFYHGPIISKIWLCENLEKIMDDLLYTSPSINIIGCWQNVLAFMMQVRRPDYYTRIDGFDLDKISIDASDRICDAWNFEKSKVYNHHVDFYTLTFEFEANTVFINCSVDQFKNKTWFDQIPIGSLVAIQTTDVVDEKPLWEITQQCKDLDTFIASYPMTKLLFSGTKSIEYTHLKYDRFMLIGIK